MSEKVRLPREVAEALDEFRDAYTGYEWMVLSEIIRSDESDRPVSHTAYQVIKYAKQSESNFVRILQALVNGYEVEETPEEKVSTTFKYVLEQIDKLGDHPQSEHWKGMKTGIITTLASLNIKVKGVNADE